MAAVHEQDRYKVLKRTIINREVRNIEQNKNHNRRILQRLRVYLLIETITLSSGVLHHLINQNYPQIHNQYDEAKAIQPPFQITRADSAIECDLISEVRFAIIPDVQNKTNDPVAFLDTSLDE